MRTKELVKQKGLELFNRKGVLNVTLRDVAEALDKSYGNITYYYQTKEHLVAELYEDMLAELRIISAGILASNDLLRTILEAPGRTFELSMNYIFLFKDFVEIRRNFPAIAQQMEKNNEAGKQNLKRTLVQLQSEELLRKDIEDEDLEYLMELSGAMRTFFLLNLRQEELKKKDLESRYVTYINRLLAPYLTAKGKKIYQAFEAASR